MDVFRLTTAFLFLLTVMSCDSRPRSRYLIANESPADLTVRLYTPHIRTAVPCLYEPREWINNNGGSCASRTRIGFEINEKENWMEAVVVSGAAVEIGNARYPAEENIEDDFSIVKVDMHGSSGAITLDGGTHAIFDRLQKEEDGFFDSFKGKSPRYIYRYK